MELINNNKEILYRNIKKDSMNWDYEFDRPSFAAFINDSGLSVDILSDRNEEDLINSFKNRFYRDKEKVVAKITVEECLDICLYPVYKPSKKNKYHAEIHNSEHEIKISYDKAMHLVRTVKIIEYN